MVDVPIDTGNDSTAGSPPSERTQLFRRILDELDETPSELARRLQNLGDYRSTAAILRSIQRMAAGDTAVSAEMLVIIRMFVNQQRQRKLRHTQVEWKLQPNGAWSANIDGFIVNLHPQSKQRWSINLVFSQTGYSPEWARWQPSLEAAKQKALTCVADGLLEVCALEASEQ